MTHRIRLTMADDPTHTVEVLCPDGVERDVRDYLTQPLHLVAWGIMEATELDSTWAEECDMEGIHDLPIDTVRESEMTFVVNGRVRVELLGQVHGDRPVTDEELAGWSDSQERR